MLEHTMKINDVFILKNFENDKSELERIGKLIEKRGKDGELLLMNLDPLSSQWEDLQGNNVLYFRKKADGLYHWIDFKTYAYECEDWEQPGWLQNACEEIVLEYDTKPPGRERGRLQRVLEDAERTIALVRQRKPIQTHTQTDHGWKVTNEVRPEVRRARTLSQALAISTSPDLRADCDFSIQKESLKEAALALQTKLKPRTSSITLIPAKNGIELSVMGAQRRASQKLVGDGEWKRRVVVAGQRLLSQISKERDPNIRLTYMAGRLFLNQASISAEEDKSQ
jgi:hypothetical protein